MCFAPPNLTVLRRTALGTALALGLPVPLSAAESTAAAEQNRPLAAAHPGDQGDSQPQAIQQLIAELGDPSFAVRQRTSRRLEELGLVAKPALVAGLQDPDAEVRHRVRRILVRVLELDFENRIAAFAAGKSATADDLPGWMLLKSIAGDGPAVRQLFIEAIRGEPLLLEALDQGHTYAAQAVVLRTQQLYQARLRNPNARQNLANNSQFAASVAALLIVIADGETELDERTASMIFQMMHRSALLRRLGSREQPVRALVGVFIQRTAETSMAYQSLWTAMQYNLKEGLIAATAIIRRGEQRPYVLQDAILAIGKLGTKEHIKLLTPLLADDTALSHQFNRQATKSITPQVRDVALAVIIHLSGEKPQDYGYTTIQQDPIRLFRSNTMRFSSDAKRAAALKTWQERLAAQPRDPASQQSASN
ncbi:MAG: hypothetical protein GTO26_00455 [Planctomycetales bacterium]|nr:hypothetical protein [Planctomycetales bacterium]